MTHEKSTEGRFGLEEWKKARVEAAADAFWATIHGPDAWAIQPSVVKDYIREGIEKALAAADAVPHPSHEEMMEAVARAIADAKWGDGAPFTWQQSIPKAKAAIEALKPWLKEKTNGQ